MPLVLCLAVCAALAAAEPLTASPPTTAWREQAVAMSNGAVEVVADPLHGGRLIAYGPRDGNILYDDPAHPNWIFPGDLHWTGPAGGRFDVGPEEVIPAHPALWTGAYAVERPSPLHLRLTSAPDQAAGLQVVRDFVLAPQGSHLRCTQTMRNISDRPLRRGYWGRTLVRRGGITLVPVDGDTRFPHRYLAYSGWPDYTLSLRPKDPAVAVRDDVAVVGPGLACKLGFDGAGGWIAHLAPSGVMFLKTYAVDRDRRYADVGGLTASLWSDGKELLEIEPLGPEELLAPGASAAFSEDWWLVPFPFPGDPAQVDVREVVNAVARTRG